MRLVSIEQVKPQVYLARSIYDNDGKTILTKGTMLNEAYINRLKELHITSVYVDEGFAQLEVDEMASEEARLLIVRQTRDQLLSIKAGESLANRQMRKTISDIVDEVFLNRNITVHLIDIFSLKDHTFTHSVNVTVLSLITGWTMGYTKAELLNLGTSALLHDVGKAAVIDCIVNRQDILVEDEYQLIRRHAERGQQILEKSLNLRCAAEVAGQHHERFNGRGYPKGLKGSEISEFARIVAIADVFDAVSTDRPYRQRLLPHEAVQIIKDAEGIDFDPGIVKAFVASITPFPLGCLVELKSGKEGIVVYVDKDFPTRPRVQVLKDNGKAVEGIQVIDLLHERDQFIVRTLKRNCLLNYKG